MWYWDGVNSLVLYLNVKENPWRDPRCSTSMIGSREQVWAQLWTQSEPRINDFWPQNHWSIGKRYYGTTETTTINHSLPTLDCLQGTSTSAIFSLEQDMLRHCVMAQVFGSTIQRQASQLRRPSWPTSEHGTLAQTTIYQKKNWERGDSQRIYS